MTGAPVDSRLLDGLVQSSFLVHEILLDVAADAGLSLSQLRLLGVLRDREPRMQELAALLGLTKSSLTGLIDRAERRDLVRRTTSPVDDARAVHVRITGEGRALAEMYAREIGVRLAAVAEGLPAGARAQLAELLAEFVGQGTRLRGVDLTPSRPSGELG